LFENYNISISSVEPVPSEVFHLIAKIGLYPSNVEHCRYIGDGKRGTRCEGERERKRTKLS